MCVCVCVSLQRKLLESKTVNQSAISKQIFSRNIACQQLIKGREILPFGSFSFVWDYISSYNGLIYCILPAIVYFVVMVYWKRSLVFLQFFFNHVYFDWVLSYDIIFHYFPFLFLCVRVNIFGLTWLPIFLNLLTCLNWRLWGQLSIFLPNWELLKGIVLSLKNFLHLILTSPQLMNDFAFSASFQSVCWYHRFVKHSQFLGLDMFLRCLVLLTQIIAPLPKCFTLIAKLLFAE